MIAMLADAFVKATLMLLLAAGASLLLRRSAAALRHLVWALAFVGVLALPVAGAIMPDWRLAAWPRFDVPVAFDAHEIATGRERVPGGASITAASAAPLSTPAPAPAPAPVAPVRWRFRADWTALVIPVWLGGMVLVLAALALGLGRLAWLGRTVAPLLDQRWVTLTEDLARGLGVRRPIRLLRSTGPAMPMTWGIWRPVILLPSEADGWSIDRRRDVLLHELAHVKRQDFLTQLIARVACAAYWFNPLAWLAAGRLRVERERACDDHVLRAGAKPSAYASHLLEIARALRAAPATSLASVAMARPSQLATRLLDVLDATRHRGVVAPRVAVPAWIAAIAVVVPLAAAAPRVAPPSSVSNSIDTIPRLPAPIVTRKRATRQAQQPTVIDTLRGCGTDGSRRSTHQHEGDDVVTISTTVGRCVVNFDADGKFTFNADFTDIATVASGGRVVVDVDYGAHDRRVTIQRSAGGGGGLERVVKVDGAARPFDDEARAWLTDVLTFVMRRAGLVAGERARWILDSRGIQGLIDELGHLSGDYTRRIYYQAAVESGKLDPAGYERLVTLAGETISSDYELAELLVAVAAVQPLTAQMQAGFVAAAKHVSSDYERHRVLQAALSRPGLSPGVQTAMLQAAADITSDYELASLLVELNDARPIDDAVRPAFFTAANSLQSDYEHRRVITAVVGRTGASRAMLADALASAKTIESDYDLAELLTEIGGAYTVDETLRPAFFAAAATIESDHERARALASVLERRDVSRPVVLALIESAKGIQSEYELGELLLTVTRNVPLDDAVRAAIRSAADRIGSQYDRTRVLEALR